jgi:lycopene cyclase domain-containing protein
MKWTYLLVDFFTVIVPFLFSFHPKIRFDRYFKPYLIANLASASIFLIWDALFTKAGVWGFNEKYITGLHFYNLPIEEVLFFFCIPFSCLFTYHCFSILFRIKWKENVTNYVLISLIIFLLLTGALNADRAYTSMTFISTALVLILLRFAFKVSWFDRLLTTYLVLLIPFFIVNGILTGTGLNEPVVWYNNQENLGLRLLTIPFEDIFYGFELIVLTVFGFERLKALTPGLPPSS